MVSFLLEIKVKLENKIKYRNKMMRKTKSLTNVGMTKWSIFEFTVAYDYLAASGGQSG